MIKGSCPHCGAPISGEKCEYCGAVFYDFSAIDISNEKPTYLKIKFPGNKIVIARAVVNEFNVTVNQSPTNFYYDNNVCCTMVSDPVCQIDMGFEVIPEKGVLFTDTDKETL